jgi:hypothetical protein
MEKAFTFKIFSRSKPGIFSIVSTIDSLTDIGSSVGTSPFTSEDLSGPARPSSS